MLRLDARKWLTVFAVVLLGLAAAQPLLTSSGRLPWAADTLIHLYRLVQLDHLIQHGIFFSRWSPDLAYGYGFPLFNFYAPLSYYAAEFFRLAGMDFAPALLAAFVLLIICAGLSMYAWASEFWGQRGGLVAATAYATAPYLLYNVYHRSALAEVAAMALVPALLWAVTRLARTGSRSFFAFTALLYAALPLTHNITALVFTPVLLLYAIVLLAPHISPITFHVSRVPHSVLRVALAFALGLGLSAFFWVPMFFERGSVQIYQLFTPEAFDYRFHFVTLGELCQPPQPVDPNLVLPPTPHSLGLIPLALALAALVLGWRRWDHWQKIAAAFAGLVMLVSVFLTLPLSRWVWDTLSILHFVQFPWRFLGLASLTVAFLSGSAFDLPHPSSDRRLLSFILHPSSFPLAIVAALIIYGIIWQYVPFLAPIVRPTVTDIHRYERAAGALGTTSAGDYLPTTVKKLPDANALTERYARADVIERLDPNSLPAEAQVIAAVYGPLSADVSLSSPAPFTTTFDIFHFAGWQARVDGTPVAITPTTPHGLISFAVPAGRHRVEVVFGSTPLRMGAEAVSLASVLALAASWLLLDRRRQTADQELPSAVRRPPSAILPALICLTVLGLGAWKSFYLDSRESVFRRTRFDGTRVEGVSKPLNINFDHRLVLIGVEPEATTVEMGNAARVALYWRAAGTLDMDYSISAQLVDERGLVYGQRDSQHPGGYPTSRWRASDYARDVHDIPLLPGTPPGVYFLRVGVYRVGTPGRLNVLDQNGAPSGTTVDVATVQVVRSRWGFLSKPTAPQPEHATNTLLVPGLVLLGYDLPLNEVNAGDSLPFTLYWQATSAQSRDLKARLDLDTQPLGSAPPISPQFSPRQLAAGDVLRGMTLLRVPASTPGGTHTLRLTLVDETGAAQGASIDLGRVTVRVPAHVMTMPSIDFPHRTSINLADQVLFVGYDFGSHASNGQPQMEIVLYWKAQQEMAQDYKSFVHVLDAAGRLVAGSDQVPAQWARPTTGWIAGEYIADPHTLTLPPNLAPGEYRLEVGLYDSASNTRLGASILLETTHSISP